MSTLYRRAADLLHALEVTSSLVPELEAADRLESAKARQVPGYYDAASAVKKLNLLHARIFFGPTTLEFDERAEILAALNYCMDVVCFLDGRGSL